MDTKLSAVDWDQLVEKIMKLCDENRHAHKMRYA